MDQEYGIVHRLVQLNALFRPYNCPPINYPESWYPDRESQWLIQSDYLPGLMEEVCRDKNLPPLTYEPTPQ